MNSSRPVTDPKLAVFEEIIARTLCQPMRYWARTGLPDPKEVSLVLRRFKDFGNAAGRARRGSTFAPCDSSVRIGLLVPSRVSNRGKFLVALLVSHRRLGQRPVAAPIDRWIET
jgi:hypothetical protein